MTTVPAPDPLPPIVVRNLSKVFRGKRGRRVMALDDVSFSVERGEVFGFLGPNGAGKSTTIKTLMGLIRAVNGEVLLGGFPAGSVAARRSVGYLPENPAFYDFLSGREYLRFVASAYALPQSVAAAAIDHWLARLDLAAAANRPIRGYSKGMVQRLGLAQALFHDPAVAVLDEPMSGLDPQGRALVKELIAELKSSGKTVFFSTHITADVEKVCDRLAIIVAGRLQTVASVEEILRGGVSGYRVVARGGDVLNLPGSCLVRATSAEVEFRVDATGLPGAIAAIAAAGGVVEVVEPLRRDLEEYFLEVVKNAAS
jgi:ABC-2 type transport system ATP-binding protein